MAIKYYTGIDLNKNELKNAQIQNCLTGQYPGSPVEGQIIYDSETHLLKVYKGAAAGWSSVGEPLTAGNYIDITNGVVSLKTGASAPTCGSILSVDDNGEIAAADLCINGHGINSGSFVLNGCEIPMSDGGDSVAACFANLSCSFYSHACATDNPHRVTASQLWAGTLPPCVKATTPELSSNDNSIATTEFVIRKFGDIDALTYKGTIAGGSAAGYGALTAAANKGDVYKVFTAGKIDGVKVEVGDMLICNTDGTGAASAGTYTTIARNWDFIQANIDGAVTGPESSTSYHVAVFNGATGKVVADGGVSIAALQLKETAVTHASNTAVGDGTHGVYVDSAGVVQRMTFSLGCDVPSSATFSTYISALTNGCTSSGGCVAVTGLCHQGNTLSVSYSTFVEPSQIAGMVKRSGSCSVGTCFRPVYVDAQGYVAPINYCICSDVPPCAKFTDTVTTVGCTTGCGNVVTAISADCYGVLTLAKNLEVTPDRYVKYDGCHAVGCSTIPVYVGSDGNAVALCYSIEKSVPANAVFTDHVTTVTDSGAGNVVSGLTAVDGNITVSKTDVPVVGTASGTISVGGTSAAVALPENATYLASYTRDAGGNIVMVSTALSVSNGVTTVTFTCAGGVDTALTCVVVYAE